MNVKLLQLLAQVVNICIINLNYSSTVYRFELRIGLDNVSMSRSNFVS